MREPAGDSPGLLVPHLPAAVERAAARWPDKVAWRFDPGEVLTFAEVDERSRSYADALRGRGIGAGDTVAVMVANRVEFPLTWLALTRLGAAIVPVNVKYQSSDAAHVLELSKAAAVVTTDDTAPLVEALGLAPVIDVADLAAHRAAPDDSPGREPGTDDPVNIQMTSGTTGRPKGCVLSHRYWLTLGSSLLTEFPHLDEHDVMLSAQPFSYLDPQWNVVAALLSGAELVVLDGFHPSTFWSKVREHRVTYVYCLAAMPTLLLRMPADPLDREHRVRAVQCSAIPPRLHADLEARWGAPWYEAFGMTETGADLRVGATDHDALVGSGSVGRPAAHRQVHIDAGPGAEVGELLLRGPGMMDRYLDDAEATARAFAGGWFHTGDLARTDDSGNVYLVGRLKDMIRRSGENVAAREVEEVLLTHPAVRLVAVVGVPDELRGEEVRAYVVADTTADELADFCAERLAPFKVPRFWSFHDDLPRTPSERVEKSKLAALAGEPVEVGR